MTYTCRRPPPVTFTLHHTPAHPPAASRPNAAKRPTPCSSSIAAHTVLPGGKRKPSTVHTSSHRRAPPAYLARLNVPPPAAPLPLHPPALAPPSPALSFTPHHTRPLAPLRPVPPTLRLPDKSKSRQVGKHHHPLTTSTNHHPAFAGLPRGKTPRPAVARLPPLPAAPAGENPHTLAAGLPGGKPKTLPPAHNLCYRPAPYTVPAPGTRGETPHSLSSAALPPGKLATLHPAPARRSAAKTSQPTAAARPLAAPGAGTLPVGRGGSLYLAARAPGPYPSATGPAPGPPLAYLTRPRRPPGPCCLGRSRSPAGENLHAPAPLPRFPAPYRSSSSHPLQPYISSSHPPPLMSARVVSGPAAHLFLLPHALIAQCNDCTMLSQHPPAPGPPRSPLHPAPAHLGQPASKPGPRSGASPLCCFGSPAPLAAFAARADPSICRRLARVVSAPGPPSAPVLRPCVEGRVSSRTPPPLPPSFTPGVNRPPRHRPARDGPSVRRSAAKRPSPLPALAGPLTPRPDSTMQ